MEFEVRIQHSDTVSEDNGQIAAEIFPVEKYIGNAVCFDISLSESMWGNQSSSKLMRFD